MAYPDELTNTIIVDGSDLFKSYGMILLDGYELSPPEPKVYTIEIPGGNGVLDITETAYGDVPYSNRKHKFNFIVPFCDNPEELKTDISTFLHGRKLDYQLSFDPGYTYKGRFTITDYYVRNYQSYGDLVLFLTIEVDADPFKYGTDGAHIVDALGGNEVIINVGRKRVSPMIETKTSTILIYNGKKVVVPPGSYKVNDILMSAIDEDTVLYINTYPYYTWLWKDFKTYEHFVQSETPNADGEYEYFPVAGVTWKEFGERKLYEWYKMGSDGQFIYKTWGYIPPGQTDRLTWNSYRKTQWDDVLVSGGKVPNVKPVYIKYEVGEL